MPIAKAIRRLTSIVPVRFVRAPHATDPTVDSGSPHANAPDPDNRGFTHCLSTENECAVLPVGLDETLAEADVPETRIRLIRVDMENGGDLYVTSSDTTKLEITMPAAAAALPGQEKMMIKFKAKATGNCFLEVRFDSVDGPIIHRLQVVINAIRRIQVKAHVPRIRGTAMNDSSGTPVPEQSANNTLAAVRGVLNEANSIYFPYGIQFNVDPVLDTSVLNLNRRGAIDLYIPPSGTDEFDIALRNNRVEHGVINICFVRQIIDLDPDPNIRSVSDEIGGVAMSARNNPNDFGVFLADWAAGGQTTAHELGHVLNLVHDTGANPKYIHINTRDDPSAPGTGIEVRDDIISRRRLMWSYTNLPDSMRNFNTRVREAGLMTYRNDAGYGAGLPGSMLAIKQFSKDRTDYEMQEVQRSTTWLLSRP